MGNVMMSMRTTTPAESFAFNESADADFDFVSIARSTSESIAVVPADPSPSSSSDPSSSSLGMRTTTPLAWISWVISSLQSFMTQSAYAKAVETAEEREQQQPMSPALESQTSPKVQTPVVETINDGEDVHQLQAAVCLTSDSAADNLLGGVVADTESVSEYQPTCDITSYALDSATMFAMVDSFLRSAASIDAGSGAYEGDLALIEAVFSSVKASNGKASTLLREAISCN